jgi:tRNA-2-methylthio-N6-dimethylallyladenosine synthase
MEEVQYNFAYHFFYSERPKTLAERKYEDDIPLVIKKKRLTEVMEVQFASSLKHHESFVGQKQEILIEGPSKKSDEQLCGRNTQYSMVIIDKGEHVAGDYVNVVITRGTTATLFGDVVD